MISIYIYGHRERILWVVNTTSPNCKNETRLELRYPAIPSYLSLVVLVMGVVLLCCGHALVITASYHHHQVQLLAPPIVDTVTISLTTTPLFPVEVATIQCVQATGSNNSTPRHTTRAALSPRPRATAAQVQKELTTH